VVIMVREVQERLGDCLWLKAIFVLRAMERRGTYDFDCFERSLPIVPLLLRLVLPCAGVA
jgi:hypothetical protein